MNEDELEWFLIQRGLDDSKRRYYHLFCSIVAIQHLLVKRGIFEQKELENALAKARLKMQAVILEDIQKS